MPHSKSRKAIETAVAEHVEEHKTKTTADYIAKRDAEKRSKCVQCGTSDKACTRQVFRVGKACCSTCGYTDTHPKPKSKPEGAPCIRCHGSGVEPHDDDID